MDFRVKLSIIRVLANRFPGADDRRRINKICDRLSDLYSRRNDVAHLPIMQLQRDKPVFFVAKLDPRTGRNPPAKPFTATQVRRWAAHMEFWAMELSECLEKLGAPRMRPRSA